MSADAPQTQLKENLAALLRPTKLTVDSLHRRVGIEAIGRGTIQRVLSDDPNPQLKSLMEIASAFGLSAWQLLTPGLDPKRLPALSTPSIAQKPAENQAPPPPETILEWLGMLLAQVPEERREAVASNLAGFAREGGADFYRPVLVSLIRGDSASKRAGQ